MRGRELGCLHEQYNELRGDKYWTSAVSWEVLLLFLVIIRHLDGESELSGECHTNNYQNPTMQF